MHAYTCIHVNMPARERARRSDAQVQVAHVGWLVSVGVRLDVLARSAALALAGEQGVSTMRTRWKQDERGSAGGQI